MHHTLDLWRWRVVDSVTGRRYVTLYRMTRANALDLDPAAERVEGSLEQRLVPDDPHSLSTSAWQRSVPASR